MATRPTIFKWRQTEPALILCAVRWYLRYSLSLRDVEELLEERGLEADHTTVWRWVQRYGVWSEKTNPHPSPPMAGCSEQRGLRKGEKATRIFVRSR
jgi:transposase, IS6 family